MHDTDNAAESTLHLAVDCDDVLVDFWPRVLRCFNKEFGESLELEVQNSWDDNPIKNSDHFGPDKAYADWLEWWRDRHWLWATCDVIPGAIGGLSALAERGHYVELVTHKPDWARREMTAWLAKWHPRFDRLTLVDLEESKAAASDADVLVDDKPRNVREWVESDPKRHAILFTRPWNAAWDEWGRGNLRVRRADSWAEVLTAIDYLNLPLSRVVRGAGPLKITSDYRTSEWQQRVADRYLHHRALVDREVPWARGAVQHDTVTPPEPEPEPEHGGGALRCLECDRPVDGPAVFAYDRPCLAGGYCTLFTDDRATAKPDEGEPEREPVVVGICGFKGAGKDTVGRILVEEYGFTRRAFADPMKDAALAALEGFNPKAAEFLRDNGWGNAMEWDPRYRRYLQAFGTEGIRSLDPDFWPRITLDALEPGERVVVTDVRFPNEVQAVKNHGGLVVRVDRPGYGADGHASERADQLDVDVVLDNRGSLADLKRQVDWLAWRWVA